MARIAYLLGSFPVLSETFIGNEMRAMEVMGHAVFPIALHRGTADFQPEDAAFVDRTLYFAPIAEAEAKRLVRKYLFVLHRIVPFALQQTTEPFYPLLVHAAQLAEYMQRNQCTHVHAHFGWGAATYAIAAARLLKLPVTFTCHGSDVYARPVDLALKCRYATGVIGVAPTITADLQALAPRTPCHVVYCGVDTECFVPAMDVARKHARWLFVGRLIDCKGIMDILATWTLLPVDVRPHLDVVGEGALRAELEEYCRQHGLVTHVTFLGAKSAAWIREYAPYYRAFISAFKQGSDGSRDTAPMVLKEAMAMGLPIVTTEFVDVPEVVGKDCAILCPVADIAALAEAVTHIQQLPAVSLQMMGQAGRERAQQYYSLARQAKEITDLIT